MPLFASSRGLFHGRQWNIINDQVEIATDENATVENLAVFLDISDMTNTSSKTARVVSDAIIERLKTKNSKVMMLTLSLLDTCMKNSNPIHQSVARKEFISEYYKIIKCSKTEEAVRLRMLGFFQEWMKQIYTNATVYPHVYRYFSKLKSQGYAFPLPDDEISATMHSPRPQNANQRVSSNRSTLNSPYPGMRRMHSAPPSALPISYYTQPAYFVPAGPYPYPYMYTYNGTMPAHVVPAQQVPLPPPRRNMFDVHHTTSAVDRRSRLTHDCQICEGQVRLVKETLSYANVNEDPSKNDLLLEFIPLLKDNQPRLVHAIQVETDVSPDDTEMVERLLTLSEEISKTIRAYDDLVGSHLRKRVDSRANLNEASQATGQGMPSSATIDEAVNLLSDQPVQQNQKNKESKNPFVSDTPSDGNGNRSKDD